MNNTIFNDYIEKIADLLRKNEIVFFVGAGISLSHNGQKGLPNGEELKLKIIEHFFLPDEKDGLQNLDFKELAQMVIWKSNDNRFSLDSFLQTIFDNVDIKPSQSHQELSKISADVISTNY